jgi:hypothetical protein
MRDRICQIGIVYLKILIYTPEIVHKIVVTLKSLKIHSMHLLVQILLQQMQLYKFKKHFHKLRQI